MTNFVLDAYQTIIGFLGIVGALLDRTDSFLTPELSNFQLGVVLTAMTWLGIGLLLASTSPLESLENRGVTPWKFPAHYRHLVVKRRLEATFLPIRAGYLSAVMSICFGVIAVLTYFEATLVAGAHLCAKLPAWWSNQLLDVGLNALTPLSVAWVLIALSIALLTQGAMRVLRNVGQVAELIPAFSLPVCAVGFSLVRDQALASHWSLIVLWSGSLVALVTFSARYIFTGVGRLFAICEPAARARVVWMRGRAPRSVYEYLYCDARDDWKVHIDVHKSAYQDRLIRGEFVIEVEGLPGRGRMSRSLDPGSNRALHGEFRLPDGARAGRRGTAILVRQFARIADLGIKEVRFDASSDGRSYWIRDGVACNGGLSMPRESPGVLLSRWVDAAQMPGNLAARLRGYAHAHLDGGRSMDWGWVITQCEAELGEDDAKDLYRRLAVDPWSAVAAPIVLLDSLSRS